MFDVNAIVLFDSGATHSFVATSFVKAHQLQVEESDRGWYITIPTGVNQVATWSCKRCPIFLGHLILPTDLIVLDMKEFDIILGMDWLSEHYAFIDCRGKRVIFEIPNEGVCYFKGAKTSTPEEKSGNLSCVLGETRYEGYLASIQEI